MTSKPPPPPAAVPAALPTNEAARLAAVRAYQILDTDPEQAYEDLVFLASVICRTPIAVLTLIDEHRQFFKAKVGLPVSETSRDVSFCAHAILETGNFVVNDASVDPRFATNPLVTGDPKIRFYAGVPLRTPDGLALGTICALDSVPRELTDEQTRALEVLARQVMVQLELRRVILGLEDALPQAAAPATQRSGPSPAELGVTAERARALLGQGVAGGAMGDRMRTLLARFEQLQAAASPGRPRSA